jgi:hypothetical protein
MLSHNRRRELFCWVFGDESNKVFSVEISDHESVGVLKVAIKDKTKPTFDHIAAHALDLYKISVPEDEVHAKVAQIDLDYLKKLDVLMPIYKLSRVFSYPLLDDDVYVVIVKPAGECERLLCVYAILTGLSPSPDPLAPAAPRP